MKKSMIPCKPEGPVSEGHQYMPDILVVDDTPANLNLLAEMLKKRGYRVRPVPNGRLAIQAIENKKPDLVLLDINMPGMNGYEVCEYLKSNAALKEIPVLFISALTETMDKVKAFAAGGVDYVTKPFQFEEVHARVETHLRIRCLQRQLSDQNENLERLVAKRTVELAKAHQRLMELGQLKDDFMRMIFHEIRTPANGVLGIGNLVLDLCPASEDHTLYADLFQHSASRLQNLIEDATMITNMEKLALGCGMATSFPNLLAEVAGSLPDMRITFEESDGLENFPLQGDPPLLKKVLESMILLAAAFSDDKHAAHGTAIVEGKALRVLLKLDALSLPLEQATCFFEIASSARSASSAETLGLAPVVAHQIITAFGGRMRLIKGDGHTGYLEAMLPREHGPV